MHELCSSGLIAEGECKEFHLGEEDIANIFITRRDGHLYAYANQCPHVGAPLNWKKDMFLDNDGDLIQCASHGALFVIETGHCVSGPCLGQHLHSYAILEQDGNVYVDLD